MNRYAFLLVDRGKPEEIPRATPDHPPDSHSALQKRPQPMPEVQGIQ
jgi:hypothetical protein